MLLCFFPKLHPQEIEKASPAVRQNFHKAATFFQQVLPKQQLFSVFSDFLFLFKRIIFKQRCNFIHLDCKYFIAILNCAEVIRCWEKNCHTTFGINFCFSKTARKKGLLFLDCISNWLRNCLLHGVTTGFCPCNSLLGNKSINFLEDASDPTPTRANLKGRRKSYTTVFPFPGYPDAS